MAPNWPLVGRSEELRFLHRAILDEHLSAIVIAGPAGVGKTRLAIEALARARHAGLATAWAVATASAAAIPFGAVAHLLPHPLPPSLGLPNLLRALGEAVVGDHPGPRLVLGVDDAHLLDDSSAALIHHLAATGGAFVVATVRTGEATPDAVRALGKDLGERLELQNLLQGEVEALVPAVLGGEVDPVALRELWSASRGNVLFLRELIVGGVGAGTLERVEGLWRWRGGAGRLPGLVELVESRLAELAAREREALEVISAGAPVGLGLIQSLVSPAAVEVLERAGLVHVSLDQRRMAVSVSHPLYAEVIRAATPASRTQSVAAELAEALEATGARRREDLLRLATWFVDAGVFDRPELFMAAATQAASALDAALAERLARAAGDAGGVAGRLMLAQALAFQGRTHEAEEVYCSSEALVSTDEERAQFAIARAMNLFFWLRRASDAEEVVITALRQVSDPALHQELLGWRSGLLLFSGRFGEGLTMALEVLHRPDAAARAVMWASLVATWGLPMAGRFRESRAIETRALAVMAEHPPVIFYAPQLIRLRRSLTGLFEGDLAGGLAALEKSYEQAMEQRWDGFLPMCRWGAGWILRVQGRVASALGRQREAIPLCREVDWGGHLPDALAEAAHAAALLGDLSAAEAYLDEAAGQPGDLRDHDFWFGLAQAWTAVARGELSNGVELARQTAEVCAAKDQWVLEAMALYDAARLSEARAVAERLVELAGIVEGNLVPALAAHASALATGDEAGLVRASETFETMGVLLYAAEAAAEASRAAAATGRTSTAMALAARARSLAAHCEGARTPALADLDHTLPLTRREREVATLAARGLSNREIAERLVVSVRTAEGHLNRAFAKLGVVQRADLRSILGGEPTRRSDDLEDMRGTTNEGVLSERDPMPHER